MDKLLDLNRKIRDSINDSVIKRTLLFKDKKQGIWDQFCTAMDTIDDTSISIIDFKKSTKRDFEKNPYLITYGILQSLYIQQDSVSLLKEALWGKSFKIDFKDKEYSKLKEVRGLRNETVGHPVATKENGNKSKYEDGNITYCFIDRSSLSKNGFKYFIYKSNNTEHKKIKLDNVIENQKECLIKELTEILKKIKEEEKKHKDKFKNEKMVDIFDKGSFYKINLICGAHWEDNLAWPSLDYFYKKYETIKEGLENRYGKFDESVRIEGTKLLIDKLDYIFKKLYKIKKDQKINFHELEVHVDALEESWNELEIHLRETDEEFSS